MADDEEPVDDQPRRAAALIDEERDREAFELLVPLAQAGEARAQVLLGWLREQGRGCDQDYQLAEQWYRASADQLYAPAQFYLGWFFQSRGEHDLAASQFERAAEQAFLPAYYRLAVAQLKRGNRREALALFQEAKQKGHLPSALKVARMVVRGGEYGFLSKLKTLIEIPLLIVRFVRIHGKTSNDERVLW